ncbi:glycoside hydrolase family 76 protein [Dysgonomonas reticulitermitis]
MNKTIIFFILFYAILVVSCNTTGAGKKKGDIYFRNAEEMFDNVWNLYRVPEYGLFSEYYPNSYKPDLTYFNDGAKNAQECSFLWPMSGVFSSTVYLASIDSAKYIPYIDSMVTAVEQYCDISRTPSGYQAYPVRFGKVDRYYDDNGLVGIDYIDAYKVTKKQQYLDKAKEVMTFIQSGWSNDFGGGTSWLEGIRDQKPACSNGKATVLALKLYEACGENEYLDYGIKSYNWMMSTLKDDSLHIIWNSLLTTTKEGSGVQKHAYTYNTGTMIQSATRLYKITKDEKYLNDAEILAEGSYNFYVKRSEDEIPYISDLPWFILVLFRGYHELYDVNQDPKYVNGIIGCADWAWEHARDGERLVYNDWTGRKDQSKEPKWLLDESCWPELLARIAMIKGEIKH